MLPAAPVAVHLALVRRASCDGYESLRAGMASVVPGLADVVASVHLGLTLGRVRDQVNLLDELLVAGHVAELGRGSGLSGAVVGVGDAWVAHVLVVRARVPVQVPELGVALAAFGPRAQ